MSSLYSIGKAAQLAGITPFVIRAWENRYKAVEPVRNEGGQRRYTDAHVTRLRTLSDLVEQGHRIGEIVRLTDDELEDLKQIEGPPICQELVEEALAAVEAFNPSALQAVLERCVKSHGGVALTDVLIFPFMEEIGRYWNEDRIGVMQEHLASAVVQAVMGRILASYTASLSAPVLVTATPPEQEHNLGALAGSLAAAEAGFQVRHLGTHLPAKDILAAVNKSGALILLLSIVFPGRPSAVKDCLSAISESLPLSTKLIVGGISSKPFMEYAGDRALQAPRTIQGLKTMLANLIVEHEASRS